MQFIFLLAAAADSALATRNCGSCVPLPDLLSPAYSLALTVDGLSSAVAFYNGSSQVLASVTGPDEYVQMMNNSLIDAIPNPSLIARSTWCRQKSSPSLRPDDDFSWHRSSLWYGLEHLWRGRRSLSSPTTLSETARLLRTQMQRLSPFKSDSSDLTVTLVVPSYLVGTQLECDIRSATQSLAQTVEAVWYPPAAAFTAYGYDICQGQSDWLACKAPGRMLTLGMEGSSGIVVASLTPSAMIDGVAFALYDLNLHPSNLSAWLDDVVQTYRPGVAAHIGSGRGSDQLADGIARSKVQSLLIDQSIRAGDKAAVVGAAQLAKEALDRKFSDCIEDQECEVTRHEADRIAGPYRNPE